MPKKHFKKKLESIIFLFPGNTNHTYSALSLTFFKKTIGKLLTKHTKIHKESTSGKQYIS